jgi:hypothetical protein
MDKYEKISEIVAGTRAAQLPGSAQAIAAFNVAVNRCHNVVYIGMSVIDGVPTITELSPNYDRVLPINASDVIGQDLSTIVDQQIIEQTINDLEAMPIVTKDMSIMGRNMFAVCWKIEANKYGEFIFFKK